VHFIFYVQPHDLYVDHMCSENDYHKNERHLSSLVDRVSFPVQHSYIPSRMDSTPHDWHIPCTDTAEVVHQLTTTDRRVYAEYQADGLLPVDPFPVDTCGIGRDSTAFCLEQKFNWVGSVHGPAHARSTELPEVVRVCPPEVRRLVHAINATRAIYLAIRGGVESVSEAVKCIPLERLRIDVLSVERRDSSVKTRSKRLGLTRATVNQKKGVDELARRGWSLHSETACDLVFVRRHDVIRRRHWSCDRWRQNLDGSIEIMSRVKGVVNK